MAVPGGARDALTIAGRGTRWASSGAASRSTSDSPGRAALARARLVDARDLSRREAQALTTEAKARRVPIVFFAIPSDGGVVSGH